MDRSSEDALWRSIVENYGDRADLDDAGASASPADGSTGSASSPGATSADATSTGATGAAPESHAGPADHGVVEGPAEPGGRAPAGGEPAAGADWEAARARAGHERAREFEARHEVPDRFVPPDPGPLPYVDPSRLVAWACVVGGPLLIVLSLTVGLPLSGFWRLMSAVAFVGGFVYLVARMPRDPRDPWDDGARV